MNSLSTTDLLLVLQKLLLLVMVNMLELLELVVLLQSEMSLVLLKVTAYCPLIPLTRCTPSSTAATWNNHITLSAQRHSQVLRHRVRAMI